MSYDPSDPFAAQVDTQSGNLLFPAMGPYAFGSTRLALAVGDTLRLKPRTPVSTPSDVQYGELRLRRVAGADGAVTALGPVFRASYNPDTFESLPSGIPLVFDTWPANTVDFSQQDTSTVEILTAGWFAVWCEIDIVH